MGEILEELIEFIKALLSDFLSSIYENILNSDFIQFLFTKGIGTFVGWMDNFVSSFLTDSMEAALNPITAIENASGLSFDKVFGIIYGYGIGLLVLKFVWKGFNTYALWKDGDPDGDPFELLVSFVKAMVTAICFGSIYDLVIVKIAGSIGTELFDALGMAEHDTGGLINFDLDQQLEALSLVVPQMLAISVFLIMVIIAWVLVYLSGMQILMLRAGLPLVCGGIMDANGGSYSVYIKKILQVMATVIVQYAMIKLSYGLIAEGVYVWGIAAALMAIKTPGFLSEFLMQNNVPGNMSTIAYRVQMMHRRRGS